MRILVTRPAGQQQALMDALQAAGYQAAHCPALRIEPLPVSGDTRRVLMDLDLYHAVFFASANAARLALTAMSDLWPQWPVGVHWLAVGRATAAELATWHLQPEVPEAGFNSEAVLALPCLQDLHEKKILICRGNSGRELLADTLKARGAEVVALPFYQRLPNPDFEPTAGCQWVMITSVESWRAVASKLPGGCGIVAAGERVAAAIAEDHSGEIRVAASAHDDDMIAALPLPV
ncbi:uroporphyrinogen-III synthase [Alcanivorax sp. S6407]|uniref:uroporphyrinogen-III synthase n=1 Tax=Alcanivorax sp. S6407 TaxID=2926424 RepID=UPI001FF18287|nr:uroporphyrinogen-III synthase [Alcanivorax sp. S6407]MCK0153663.1 uroporphyrinogen-III synthase [Alcanivorax sp. S6407]